RGVKVRDGGAADLALVAQPDHLGPGVLDGRAALVGPVELIEIDALDAEPPQRRVALSSDRLRPQRSRRLNHRIGVVPDETAFGEDERTRARGTIAKQTPDDLFGVAEAVDGGCIDPVDAAVERLAHRRERRVVVLRTPAERPPAAADRPGAEADGRDVKASLSKRASRHHRP